MRKCVVCGSGGTDFVLKKQDAAKDGGDLILLRCRACRSVFLPEGREVDTDEVYGYYARSNGLDKERLYDPLDGKRYLEVLKYFEKIAPGRDILDVGCGNGHFIDTAIRSGWNARGIEVSQPAVDTCRRFGLPVEKLDFFSERLMPESVDALTMFEVMEHVPDPSGFLKRSETVLHPGGILFLTTPNFNSLDRRFLGAKWHVIHYEHLNYFTPEAVRRITGSLTGLRIHSLKTKNISMELFSRLLKKGGKTPEIPEKPTYNVNNSCVNQEQRLRNMAENSLILNSGKKALNHFLNLFECGSTINAVLQKPGKT